MEDVIDDVVRRIVADYRPDRIILFGSHAYGEPDEESDIDLLIIKETDEPPMQRWMQVKRLLRDRTRRVSIAPLIYTKREIEERLRLRDFFIRDVLEKGIVVYG
jgi:predicted nucleotidyltransferase